LKCCPATNQTVRAMTCRMNGALIASLSAVALVLGVNETFAGTGTVPPGAAPRGAFASPHSMSHRSAAARSFRHHRRNDAAMFWPAIGDFSYDPSTPNGGPMVDVTPPISGDAHYTYTYDVPWDWAHRFPPAVTPSDRPYVPSCPAESVTVPGHDGKEQAVSITRCY
jgi:hypothetical protein